MRLPTAAPLNADARRSWPSEIWQRFLRHQWLKAPGITAFVWLFFYGYFELLRHPVHPVTVMPLTALDHWIGFQPPWLWPYLSLWLYVGMAPGLMLTLRELLVFGAWSAAFCATGLACFYFWPTAIPPLPLDASGYPGFATLQGVDAAGNACPSMHVAAAVYAAAWFDRVLRVARLPQAARVINLAWCLAIIYSTMAIKQHVALDALAGAALGAAFAVASVRCTRRPCELKEP